MRRLSFLSVIALVFVFAGPMPAEAFASPPANDNFAEAQPLMGVSGVVEATNLEATKEPGEPAHAGDPGGASIWFRWTAPWRGDVGIQVFSPDRFTLLAVYTGASVEALSAVASDVDGYLRFRAVKGTTYMIAIDRAESTSYYYDFLDWRLLNDDFRDPWPITGASGRVPQCPQYSFEDDWDGQFSLCWIGRTRESGEPQHGLRSVWFRWTAPTTAWFRFQVEPDGSLCQDSPWECREKDTVLAVYRGSRLAALKTVALNDDFSNQWWFDRVDSFNNGLSHLDFRAIAGMTYRIALAETRWTVGGSSYVLSWTRGRILQGGPGNDILIGGPGNDYIKGRDGNDVIFGNGGEDTLIGGRGVDMLHGGPGNDRLHGHIPRTGAQPARPQSSDVLYGNRG